LEDLISRFIPSSSCTMYHPVRILLSKLTLHTMECRPSPFIHPFTLFSNPFNRNPFHQNPFPSADLARLNNEKDILENGLANCVTYLNVLRKKQARNERLLNTDPLPPRKKKKKVQQNKRELDKEIKHRERDEQAYLTNLQACKVNIYMMEGVPYTPIDFSPTLPDYASSTTQCSYDEWKPTEISWNGWADDAVMSPFDSKRRSNPFFTVEVAPDEMIQDIQHIEEFAALPVPPNTAHPHCRQIILSPVAPTFEPSIMQTLYGQDNLLPDTSKLETPPKSFRDLLERRVTDAGISRMFQILSVDRPQANSVERTQTWCNTTPQRSPRTDGAHDGKKKSRNNSL
jgi:hypothetical protein